MYKGLKRFLAENHYDAIVINTSVTVVVTLCMMAARKCKALLIPHAHNTDLIISQNTFRYKFRAIIKPAENVLKKYICRKASYLFTNTEDAAKVTFGVTSKDNKKVRIMKCAIDLDKFSFKEEIRSRIRKEMNISDDTFVYGNVGKLQRRKNQLFLIRIFSEIHKVNDRTQLWLVGDETQRKDVEKLISELNLETSVKLLGQRTDVNDVMQGMDSFLFPTLSEGLGIVAIEAQAAGLPTTISDGVPDDVMITELMQKIMLKEDAFTWAQKIMAHDAKFPQRKDYSAQLRDAGYDTENESRKITEFYCNNTF